MDEIVLCRVTKMFPNSVFADLEEYEHKQGMIHISEVSPGRIRNLRDYISLDRQIVCKVLRIDLERGHIDLSLRRVNYNQKMEKLEQFKNEQKAEHLLENLSKKLKRPLEGLYKEVTEKVLKEYPFLYSCFKDVAAGNADLEKLGLEKKLAAELTAAIIEKFKPPKIFLKGTITLETYASDGLEKIKTSLQKIEKLSPTITIMYLGGGKYKLTIEDIDYKPAEATLAKAEEILQKFNDKISKASFEREKTD